MSKEASEIKEYVQNKYLKALLLYADYIINDTHEVDKNLLINYAERIRKDFLKILTEKIAILENKFIKNCDDASDLKRYSKLRDDLYAIKDTIANHKQLSSSLEDTLVYTFFDEAENYDDDEKIFYLDESDFSVGDFLEKHPSSKYSWIYEYIKIYLEGFEIFSTRDFISDVLLTTDYENFDLSYIFSVNALEDYDLDSDSWILKLAKSLYPKIEKLNLGILYNPISEMLSAWKEIEYNGDIDANVIADRLNQIRDNFVYQVDKYIDSLDKQIKKFGEKEYTQQKTILQEFIDNIDKGKTTTRDKKLLESVFFDQDSELYIDPDSLCEIEYYSAIDDYGDDYDWISDWIKICLKSIDNINSKLEFTYRAILTPKFKPDVYNYFSNKVINALAKTPEGKRYLNEYFSSGN